MLDPLYTAISWALLRWHALWAGLLGASSSIAWGLAIVFLVVTLRIILFPLFVKQIKSQRAMQELAPKIKELQAKYKNDKESQQREMMALYKEHGANPVAGCLPVVLQAPVFISLYHVLRRLRPDNQLKTLYGWSSDLFTSAAHAQIFGAPISGHFTQAFTQGGRAQLATLGAKPLNVALVAGVLVVIMVATTYITQRQMIARQKSSGQAQDKQQTMMQRLMLFGIPVVLLFTGTSFPLGVVIYWCTTNVWSMGQQFYVLHRMPTVAPGQGGDARTPEQIQAARALAPRPGVKPGVKRPGQPAVTNGKRPPQDAPSAGKRTPAKPANKPTRTPAKPASASASSGTGSAGANQSSRRSTVQQPGTAKKRKKR